MNKLYLQFNRGLLFLVALLSSVTLFAQSVCNQFDYFYADITYPTSGIQTDIYSVAFTGGDAVLSPIIEDLPYGAHIAFNINNGLIYVVEDGNGDIRTLDPVLGTLGSAVSSSVPFQHISTAAINEDGKLLIGSMVTHEIYQVDLNTNPYGVSVYDSNDDISGGDLAWTNSGLYLASKPHGALYTVLPGMLNMQLGNVEDHVTGMATMADGDNVVVSSRFNSSFKEYEVNGGVNEVNSYDAMLNGQIFTLGNGDMASGCSSFSDIGDCEDFQFFYINDNSPDVPTGTVMSGTFVGNNFVLASLFQSGISGHLAVNKDNGDFYVVRQDRVKTFSSTGTLLNDVTIQGNIGKITAAVWNPEDNMVYIGSQNGNAVYIMNPLDGSNTLFAANLPVYGGDLILDEAGNLFVVERVNSGDSKLYDITSGTAVYIADVAPSINGAAMTNTGDIIMAEGDGSQNFHLYDASGTSLGVFDAVDNLGNPMTLVDGDMASGCFGGNNPGVSECSYSMYYTNYVNQGSSNLLELTINPDNTVSSSLISTIDYGSTSSAVSPEGFLYIPNRFGSGFYTIWDVNTNAQVSGQIPMTTAGGDNIQNVGGATYHNGLLYVTSLDGTIYGLNPATGVAQIDMPGYSNGSDLVFDQTGDLYVISRDAGIFYNVTQGTSFTVSIQDIDGIALLSNGNLAAVNGDLGTTMHEVDQSAGVLTGNTFDLGFTVQWGDLSSACVEPSEESIPGSCNATEVVEYVEGTSSNGGSIALDRTDASQALGDPERVDQLVFVSLGYGGSLTLAFDGYIPNEAGADIEIVETTYNNSSCSSYPELADVYVSLDGVTWAFAKTVCRADGFVDISDAGSFSHVNFVKIVNNDDLSSTPDAFDVDGVVALHNCESDDDEGGALEAEASLTTYPNPSNGDAEIVFVPAEQGKSTLEVMDMNGRVVKTLFAQDVQAGETYTVELNGTDLPNGLYITRLTTNSKIEIGKIMIAR